MRSTTCSTEPPSTPGRTRSAIGPNWWRRLSSVQASPRLTAHSDLRRVASDVGAVAVQHVALGGERLGRTNGTFHPSAKRAAMRSVRFSPPPPTQIGSASWIGRGSLRAVVDREPRALERRLVVAQQAAEDGDALLQLVHAGADRREVDPVGLVLDLGPTGADAHRRPPAGDQVDGGDRLGQHGRVAVADRVDERAALDPLGLAGQRGVHRHRLQAGGVVGIAGGAVEVVPDRDPVEAERLDPLPQQPQLVGRWCAAARCAPRTSWPKAARPRHVVGR